MSDGIQIGSTVRYLGATHSVIAIGKGTNPDGTTTEWAWIDFMAMPIPLKDLTLVGEPE